MSGYLKQYSLDGRVNACVCYWGIKGLVGPLLAGVWLWLGSCVASAAPAPPKKGIASWYGEEHRGQLMANGRKFNPDRLTAASWFYPLGAKVLVTSNASAGSSRSVLVTITDRGPAQDLVRDGRIIDLAHAAFLKLAAPEIGLLPITVQYAR